jgi:Cytosine deaminase and related metal-dependent hydrolases
MGTLCIADGEILRPDGDIERADVLVDQEAGEIVDIGADLSGDDRLNADGGLVIPGLVNAHTHVSMSLLRGYADDKTLDAWLREDIWPVEAELTPEDIKAGAELGILEMIRAGTTAFADMYFSMDEVASVVDRAGVRARLGHGVISVAKSDTAAQADFETGIETATTLQGAADGRVQTMLAPHSLTTVDDAMLAKMADEAATLDVPVHAHVSETEDEVAPITEAKGDRPAEYADDLGLLGPRTFVAHGVHLDEAEIQLLADHETAVIHCPASNMKLASGIAPVNRLIEAGVTVGLGTDGAGSNNDLDMFDEMRDAAMIGKLGADDASALPAPAVLNMATQGGADAIGLPGGRLESGGTADIAVIDFETPHLTPVHDPVSHLVYAAKGSDVRHTVCDGTVLMRDREVTTLDGPAILDRARTHAHDLTRRAESADE